MTFSFTTDKRIIHRWAGSQFEEQDLAISGAGGISVNEDSTGFTISGAAVQFSVEDDGSPVSSTVDTLDFQHALSASGSDTVDINVVESEFTTVVFLTGDQVIAGNKTFENNVVIEGNLVVSGTETILNTETLEVEDNIVVLNSTFSGSPTLDAGIEVERGDEDNAQLLWDETNNYWVAGTSGSLERILTESDLTAISGDLDTKLDLDGGNSPMTGFLTLFADPTASGHAANKYYVDQGDASTLASAQSYADAGDSSTLSSANSYTDSEIASLSGYAEDAFVNISGDTMTGFLTLNADPTDDLHAVTKQYVDAQVSSATIEVREDDALVVSGAGVMNFTSGLNVTLSGSDIAEIEVDDATVMFLAGDQTATGKKTFDGGLAVASGVAPADSSDTQGGVEGELRWDDDFIYVYVGSQWKRTAVATF